MSFYAHTEGRRAGILRAIECGLRAATFNIVYPPSLDEVEATRGQFDMTVNPQSFRLPFRESTRPPRSRDFLATYGQVAIEDLVEHDEFGVPRELTPAGESLCRDFCRLQVDFGATEIIAPYFLSTGLDDPSFEVSLLCAQFLDSYVDNQDVFAGVMMNEAALLSADTFDRLADRLTSPDVPQLFYLDIDLNVTRGRPLRDRQTLRSLKRLFDAMDDADKYTLLARCNIEGLLLRAATGLSAFSSSYFQSERVALHNQLHVDFEPAGGYRAPTPFLLSPGLLTDIPRDVVRNMTERSRKRLLTCGCESCDEVINADFASGTGALCAAHFYACLTRLDREIDARRTRDGRIDLILGWIEDAEGRSENVAARAGTFTHLAAWRQWLESI